MLTARLPIEEKNIFKFILIYLMKKKFIYFFFAPFIDFRQCLLEMSKDNTPDKKYVIQSLVILMAITIGFIIPIFFPPVADLVNDTFGFSKFLAFFPVYFCGWLLGSVASGITDLAFDIYRYMRYGDHQYFLTKSRTKTISKEAGIPDSDLQTIFYYLRDLHYKNVKQLVPKKFLSTDLEVFMHGQPDMVLALFDTYAPFYQAKIDPESPKNIINCNVLLTELAHLMSISKPLLKAILQFCFDQINRDDIELSPQYAKCVEYLIHGNHYGLASFVVLQILEYQISLVANQSAGLINKALDEIDTALQTNISTLEALDEVMQSPNAQSSLAPPVNVRKTSNSSSKSGHKDKINDISKVDLRNLNHATDIQERYAVIRDIIEDIVQKNKALKTINSKVFLHSPTDIKAFVVQIQSKSKSDSEPEGEFEQLRNFYKSQTQDNILHRKTNTFSHEEYSQLIQKYAPDFFKNSHTTRGSQLDMNTEIFSGWYATQNNPLIKQKSSSSELYSDATHTSEIHSEHIESQNSQSMEKRM